MPDPWNFVILASATFYLSVAYRRGGLFAGWRAYFESQPGSFLGDLMTCPLCLTGWVAAAAVALWTLGELGPPLAAHCARAALAALACAGAATWLSAAWDEWVR